MKSLSPEESRGIDIGPSFTAAWYSLACTVQLLAAHKSNKENEQFVVGLDLWWCLTPLSTHG